jgi:hypothetical protein
LIGGWQAPTEVLSRKTWCQADPVFEAIHERFQVRNRG